MRKIMAVDDNQDNLMALEALIGAYLPDTTLLKVLSGKEALEIVKKEEPDLFLLDIIMPEMDGYELCQRLREQERTKYLPIIMITAIRTDAESRVKALNVGADAFLSKPIEPEELIAQIQVMFRIKQAESTLRKRASYLESDLLRRTDELIESNKQLQSSHRNLISLTERLRKEIEEREKTEMELKTTVEATIQAMSQAEEMRDPYTSGHQRRVGQLATAIAQKMNLDENKIRCISAAAALHDIGKISIPSQILIKPTRLTKAEYNLIKTHSQNGYDILKNLHFFCPIAEIVLQHHERINGSGYPQGLLRDKIYIEALIIGVADVVEAMAANRPYRPALGIQRALDEIKRGRGDVYDETVADACLELFDKDEFSFS